MPSAKAVAFSVTAARLSPLSPPPLRASLAIIGSRMAMTIGASIRLPAMAVDWREALVNRLLFMRRAPVSRTMLHPSGNR
ncbi:hypothetical protein GCM10023067_17680 [Aminobacter aganoensis]